MKIRYYIASLIVMLILVSITINPNIAKAIGGLIRSGIDMPTSVGAYAMTTNSSTTTPNFMRNGTATTTLTFPSETFSSVQVQMLVKAYATTTGSPKSYIEMRPQASDNGVDFFDYDLTVANPATQYSATTTIQLASTTIPYDYRPATVGATTTKQVSINLLPSRYTRLIFTVASSTAVSVLDQMDLWVNVIGNVTGTLR